MTMPRFARGLAGGWVPSSKYLEKASGMDVEIRGFNELEALLRQLPEKLRRRVIGPATAAGLRPALMKAKNKARAMRSPGTKKTGILAKSLGMETLKRRRNRTNVVVSMGPRKTFKTAGKEPYSYASYYGMVVEFGWSDTGIAPSKKSVRAGWMKRAQGSASRPPNPFMRTSLEEQAPRVLNDMMNYIGNKIEKEASKLAKKK